MDMPDFSDAACAGMGLDVFFEPDRSAQGGDPYAAARAVCRDCPILRGCLEFALGSEQGARGTRFGVYGGLSPAERDRLSKARRTGLPVGVSVPAGRPARARSTTPRLPVQPTLRPCGSRAAFRRHETLGQNPCEDCWVAERAYQAERKRNATIARRAAASQARGAA